MKLHPATMIFLDKTDIEFAIKNYIYQEYPEYKSNHSTDIETNIDTMRLKVVCYTPMKANESDGEV